MPVIPSLWDAGGGSRKALEGERELYAGPKMSYSPTGENRMLKCVRV